MSSLFFQATKEFWGVEATLISQEIHFPKGKKPKKVEQ